MMFDTLVSGEMDEGEEEEVLGRNEDRTFSM